jgi:AraC-like DNA-binding protein
MSLPKTNITTNGTHYQLRGKLESVIDRVFIEHFFSKKVNQGIPKRIVPDNTVELIFTDKRFERRLPKERQAKILYSHLSGLKTSWQDIVLDGSPIISVRFKPEKIYQLTKIPASEFVDQTFQPVEIFGKTFDAFQDKLFNVKDTSDRLDLIENYFLHELKDANLKDDLLFKHAKGLIESSKGTIRIKQLCAELGVSQKTMENKFKGFLGVNPKEYCRLTRFICTVQQYNFSKTNLTQLAYEQSYSDQSHLIKDFINFTGLSPKDFFSQPKGIQEEVF